MVEIDGFRIMNEIEEEAKITMTPSKKWKCLQCGLVINTKHNVLQHIRASAAYHKKKPKTKKNTFPGHVCLWKVLGGKGERSLKGAYYTSHHYYFTMIF